MNQEEPEISKKLSFHEKILVLSLVGIITYWLFYLAAEGIIISGVTIWYTDFIYAFLFVLVLKRLALGCSAKIHFKGSFWLYLFMTLIFMTAAISTVLYGVKIIGAMRAYVPLVLTVYTILFLRKENVSLLIDRVTKYTVPIILIAFLVLEPKAYWNPAYPSTEMRHAYQVLNASSVLFIAVLFIYFIIYNRSRPSKKTVGRVLVFLFLLVIISQQHRSVWMFSGAALLIYGLKSSAVTVHSIGKLALLLLVVFLLGALYSQIEPGVFSSFSRSLSESFQGIVDPGADETSNWRLLYLQAAMSGIGDHLIFGSGFSEDTAVYLGKMVFVNSPHSSYLALLMNYGLVGLVIFLMYVMNVIIKLNKSIKANWNNLSQRSYYLFVECCIVGFLAFGLAYSLDPIMFLVFGLAEL